MAESINQLSSLRGEAVTAVRFGRGFVEFEFGDQAIRVLTHLEFHARGFRISSSESGSRDAFCSLIGDHVAEFDITSGAIFNLVFKSGARVSIPIADAQRGGHEAMQYTKYRQRVVEW